MNAAPLAAVARRLTPRQRAAALLVLIILVDFGADDGCDCGDATGRAAASVTRTR